MILIPTLVTRESCTSILAAYATPGAAAIKMAVRPTPNSGTRHRLSRRRAECGDGEHGATVSSKGKAQAAKGTHYLGVRVGVGSSRDLRTPRFLPHPGR